jgi:hypothetical protein
LLGAANALPANGGSNLAGALAFLDWDVNQGTNNGVAWGQTLLALESGYDIYDAWETHASTYTRNIECYEGGFECNYPATTTCTTIGIDVAYGGPTGKIAKLLDAYKNSSLFYDTVLKQMKQNIGTQPGSPARPRTITPAWLALGGPSQWSLYPGDVTTTPYKSYDAIVTFNHS